MDFSFPDKKGITLWRNLEHHLKKWIFPNNSNKKKTAEYTQKSKPNVELSGFGSNLDKLR